MPRVARILAAFAAAGALAAPPAAAQSGAVELHRVRVPLPPATTPSSGPLGEHAGVRHYHVLELAPAQPGRHRLAYPLPDPATPPPLWAAPLGNVAVDDAFVLAGALVFDVYVQALPARVLVGRCDGADATPPPTLVALGESEPPARLVGVPAPADAPCDAPASSDAAWLDRLRDRSAVPGDVERYRAPDRAEDKRRLDAELSLLFGNERPEDPAARAHAILAHVAQRLRLEPGGAMRGSEVLAAGGAYCHGMALAFVALCRRAGVPARVNALYNLGLMQSHNMAEVWLDGGWRLVDPTYGLYFPGPVDSLRALMASGGAPQAAMQIDQALWTGNPAPAAWRPLSPDARYGDWPFTLAAFHKAAFTRADPVLWSEGSAAVFPVALALDARGEAWAGAVDGSLADQFPRDAEGNRQRHAGMPVLGRMGLGEAMLLLTVGGAADAAVQVTLHPLSASAPGAVRAVAIAGVRGLAVESDGAGIRLLVDAVADEAVALIGLEAGGLPIDAIHARRVDRVP